MILSSISQLFTSQHTPFMASLAHKSTPILLTTGLTLGGIAALAYASTCFALYSYQRNLIFRPLPGILRTPADIGLPYEDVWIPATSSDGNTPEKLHSWYIPNPGSDQTLLFCHGNYGNVSYNLERIRLFYELGFSILAFDYRGFGLSTHNSPEPVPTEKSLFADVETAWQYLVTERQVLPQEITLLGHSMGGAVAIELATHHPDAARLIIEASFTSMEDAVHAKKIYSLFPVKQILTEPFDSISKVRSLKLPILYVHGAQDSDVPTPMSQRLYEASLEPKQLWISADSGHNDIATTDGEGYKQAVKTFIGNTASQAAGAIGQSTQRSAVSAAL